MLDSLLPVPILSGDFVMKPGARVGPRTIGHYEITYFPGAASGAYVAAGVTHPLTEPCVAITRPHETHTFQFHETRPVRHQFVVFDFPHPDAAGRFSGLLRERSVVVLAASSPVPMLIKHFLHLSESRPPGWMPRCCALLLSVLEELMGEAASRDGGGASPAVPPPLARAVEYMLESRDAPIRTEELARRIGWSSAYFARAFKRCYGMTPTAFMNRLRMEHAAQLLLRESFSVKEIADKLGYDNEHYFSRLFKQVKGLSATEYRRRFADPRFPHVAVSNEREQAYQLNRYYRYESK